MTQDPRQFPGPYPGPLPTASPYTPPDPMALAYGGYAAGYDPYTPLRVPAKRAGLMMIIIGGLVLACGLCLSMGASFIIHPPSGPEWGPFNDKRSELLAQLQRSNQSPEQFLAMSVATLVIGLAFFVLGFFVRGGGKTAVRMALGLDVLVLGLLGLLFLRDLITILGSGRLQALGGLLFQAIAVAIFAIILMLLLQASRNALALATAQEQFRRQYWQYQQQQQFYGPGGYPPQVQGGGPPAVPSAFQTPPPPPPARPPSDPTPPPPSGPGGGGTT